MTWGQAKFFRQDQEAITILKISKLDLIEVIHLSKQGILTWVFHCKILYQNQNTELQFVIYLLKNSERHILMCTVYFEKHQKVNALMDGYVIKQV